MKKNRSYTEQQVEIIRQNSNLKELDLSLLTGLKLYTVRNIKRRFGIYKNYVLSDIDCKKIEMLAKEKLLYPKEIADNLGIPHKKVYCYIYHKLGVRYLTKKIKP